MEYVRKMLKFIEKSPCCYQVVENMAAELEAAGYTLLKENQKWELLAGGKYYVDRNGSSLIAFTLPRKEMQGFHIVASHSDSPCFKIKENEEMTVEDRYVKLNVEKYGGMILSTWLDRPLSAAGRVIVADRQAPGRFMAPVVKNVVVEKDLFIIPNVAIHMNREINKGIEYNVQTDMLPLCGGAENRGAFRRLIAQVAGVEEEDILGSDLFLYNREKGRIFGAAGEFICAPRLDDLECVYLSLQGMLHALPEKYGNVLAVFDNEEVGSSTRQGAASTFLKDTLQRICIALHINEDGY